MNRWISYMSRKIQYIVKKHKTYRKTAIKVKHVEISLHLASDKKLDYTIRQYHARKANRLLNEFLEDPLLDEYTCIYKEATRNDLALGYHPVEVVQFIMDFLEDHR